MYARHLGTTIVDHRTPTASFLEISPRALRKDVLKLLPSDEAAVERPSSRHKLPSTIKTKALPVSESTHGDERKPWKVISPERCWGLERAAASQPRGYVRRESNKVFDLMIAMSPLPVEKSTSPQLSKKRVTKWKQRNDSINRGRRIS